MPARRARSVLLRLLLGLGVAALLLGATELTLRVAYGPPAPPTLLASDNSFTGRPFDLDRGMVSVAYQRDDAIDPFPVQPTPGVPRVLFFGGSSVHGGSRLPSALEFPDLVQGLLDAQGQRVEVLNLAQPGQDSDSARPLLSQALSFQPALVVFYMGHNDLGNTIMQARYPGLRGALEARVTVALQRLKIHELLASNLQRELLTAHGRREAWNMPPLTVAQRLVAADLFERNLAWMAEQVHGLGGQVLLVTPISDMTTKPNAGASEAASKAGLDAEDHDLDAALAAQPDRADLLWQRGIIGLRDGVPGACADLRRAADLDPRPLHASEAMADAMRAAAAASGARLLDLRAQVLEDHCIPPTDWFIDDVHLSERGHRQVAALVAPAVAAALAER